jgi:hypothetical protein
LANRLARALRRVLREHEHVLNTVGGAECVVEPGSALGEACDVICDWADVRGVVDDPQVAPWRRW